MAKDKKDVQVLTPEEIEEALTKKERELLHIAQVSGSIATWTFIQAMESLARSRILSEKRRKALEAIKNKAKEVIDERKALDPGESCDLIPEWIYKKARKSLIEEDA